MPQEACGLVWGLDLLAAGKTTLAGGTSSNLGVTPKQGAGSRWAGAAEMT